MLQSVSLRSETQLREWTTQMCISVSLYGIINCQSRNFGALCLSFLFDCVLGGKEKSVTPFYQPLVMSFSPSPLIELKT